TTHNVGIGEEIDRIVGARARVVTRVPFLGVVEVDEIANLALINQISKARLVELAVERIMTVNPATGKKQREGRKCSTARRLSVKRIERLARGQRIESILPRLIELSQESIGVDVHLIDVDGTQQAHAVVPDVAHRQRCLPADVPLNREIPLLDIRSAHVWIYAVAGVAADANDVGIGGEVYGNSEWRRGDYIGIAHRVACRKALVQR